MLCAGFTLEQCDADQGAVKGGPGPSNFPSVVLDPVLGLPCLARHT